jgi:hypothetical protein
MTAITDPTTFSVPRTVVTDIVHLSGDLAERMHDLLEPNSDGQLSRIERRELETLVRVAEFGQIVSMPLQTQGTP